MAESLGYQELLILSLPLSLIGLIAAFVTSGRRYPQSVIDRVNPNGDLVTATPARRLAGHLLDSLIVATTLLIGWLIWLAIVAPRGQTPGKALVRTHIVRGDGRMAGAGFVLVREILVKTILFSVLSVITLGLANAIGALWCLWNPNKQCLWDKVAHSYVAHRVRASETVATRTTTATEDLRNLRSLLDDGILTEEEYEQRRVRLVERL